MKSKSLKYLLINSIRKTECRTQKFLASTQNLSSKEKCEFLKCSNNFHSEILSKFYNNISLNFGTLGSISLNTIKPMRHSKLVWDNSDAEDDIEILKAFNSKRYNVSEITQYKPKPSVLKSSKEVQTIADPNSASNAYLLQKLRTENVDLKVMVKSLQQEVSPANFYLNNL